jgi:hypothetical protein
VKGGEEERLIFLWEWLTGFLAADEVIKTSAIESRLVVIA